jgi:hypothetical protein
MLTLRVGCRLVQTLYKRCSNPAPKRPNPGLRLSAGTLGRLNPHGSRVGVSGQRPDGVVVVERRRIRYIGIIVRSERIWVSLPGSTRVASCSLARARAG